MSKFHSDWIERDTFYLEEVSTEPGFEGVPHFKGCERPVIVCLCGSTRFKQHWYEQNKRLTYEGKIVLGVGDLDPNAPGTNVPLDPEMKARLDELHKRKIDLADEVFVLNGLRLTCTCCRRPCEDASRSFHLSAFSDCCRAEVNMRPYVGDSTRSEIAYAIRKGKPVTYLNPPEN